MLGSCDTCKQRIRLMAQRIAETGWERVIVKIVYEIQQSAAPRVDRASNQTVYTDYGALTDPKLPWKKQSKYRQGAPKPSVNCEAFSPINMPQVLISNNNSTTTTTTTPQQIIISNNTTQQPEKFQETDPAWLQEAFGESQNDLTALEELASMIMVSFDREPDLQPLYRKYLKAIYQRLLMLVQIFALDLKDYPELMQTLKRMKVMKKS